MLGPTTDRLRIVADNSLFVCRFKRLGHLLSHVKRVLGGKGDDFEVSHQFFALEVLHREASTFLGIILYELLAGWLPFNL